MPFYKEAFVFLNRLSHSLELGGISLEKHWDIDHICHRVATVDEYEALKIDFSKFAKMLAESPVNGRPIATFKLNEPLSFQDWRIDLVELPAPKPEKVTNTGFEHIEIVCDIPFQELKKKYPNARFQEAGLQKNFNQELEIELDNCAIKFHQLSLESVVNLEKNTHVFETIEKLGILSDFRAFHPLIAGTFPLDIHIENSDVDVLMSTPDLPAMKNLLEKTYGILPNFKIQATDVHNDPTAFASFTFNNLDFEVFVQNKDAVKQRGYRHFLIEERLLKIGGPKFKKEIQTLRRQGFKTEPAFAKALNLPGDPYLALLELQKLDLHQLSLHFPPNP